MCKDIGLDDINGVNGPRFRDEFPAFHIYACVYAYTHSYIITQQFKHDRGGGGG